MLSYHLELPAETFLLLFAVCVVLPALPIALIHWKLRPVPIAVWWLAIAVSCTAGLSLCAEIWLSKISVKERQLQIGGMSYQVAGEIVRHSVIALPGRLQDYPLYRRNGLDLHWSKKGHYQLADGPVFLAVDSGALYQLHLTDGRRIWLSVAAEHEQSWLQQLRQYNLLAAANPSSQP
jgi:hypothetical protein